MFAPRRDTAARTVVEPELAQVAAPARVVRALRLLAALCLAGGLVLLASSGAVASTRTTTAAAVVPAAVVPAAGPTKPASPSAPTPAATPAAPGSVHVSVNGVDGTPSSSITVLLGITVLSVAPSLLIMTTSFTKIFVVLAMTRNALGLQGVPPNQAIAGLALFLSLFVMAPTIGDINTQAVQPYLHGQTSFSEAIGAGEKPLATFMVAHTREQDLALVTRAAQRPNPQSAADVPFTTLAPAFMLSELRAAFIMGFVIFVPFLVIDLVVSSSLMAMGMMMLPPVMVSLPFKLLLFVLVDGWGLVIKALLGSYTGAGG
ncbi:hypothetical protein CELL_00644 [Cellulomonas sp. T2.31MG-18]|uniref:flagellar type III secretion system pore protein FliP n=1 Tax=Cellulomonas sp. T2.31MG-18 TaxID=3157619 RepID=UPI0035E5FC3B